MFTNYLNAVVGRNQEFDDLIKAKDISRVKSLFQSREEETAEAMMEYDTRTHEINKRQDKIVRNKLGQRKGIVKRWKLPLNYPQYINEISVVFIYGRPVKWTLQGETGEKAFEAFKEVIKNTRFDSKVRQCKRRAGAESQSAQLFNNISLRYIHSRSDIQMQTSSHGMGSGR